MEIEFRALTKRFSKDRDILHEINFADDVRTLAVIGPSGGGKSTLLRILGGLIPPTSGKVFVDGSEIVFLEPQLEIYRRKIGFVFQQGGLFKHLNAIENIRLPLIKVHGLSPEAAAARAEELLRRFDLLDHALKKPAALSGGQQQRVAIARAVAAKPKLILLDEPTSALDPEYTSEVLDTIGELKSDGMDFIIVTHEMGFARHACDKVLFLSDGAILEYGGSADIFDRPQTEQLRRFLGKLLAWNI